MTGRIKTDQPGDEQKKNLFALISSHQSFCLQIVSTFDHPATEKDSAPCTARGSDATGGAESDQADGSFRMQRNQRPSLPASVCLFICLFVSVCLFVFVCLFLCLFGFVFECLFVCVFLC